MSRFCTKCGKALADGQVCDCGGDSMDYQVAQTHYENIYANHIQQDQQYAQQYNPQYDGGYNQQYNGGYNQPYSGGYNQGYNRQYSRYSQQGKTGIDFDARQAESAWINFKNKVGIGEPETNSEDKYERGKKIVPECVKAIDDEVPVKQYVIAKLRSLPMLHWAEGRIQVTSKRVIFRAPGHCLTGKTILQHEFDINEISGIEAKKEPHFGLFEVLIALLCSCAAFSLIAVMFGAALGVSEVLGVILSLLGMVAGVIPPFVLHKKFLLKTVTVGAAFGCVSVLSIAMDGNVFAVILTGLVAILWAICLILCGLKTSLAISIQTKTAERAIIIRKNGRACFAKSYSGFNEIFPLKDTEKAIRELGAVIKDIQELGEQGVNKWRQ